jgi:beta-N-acetylhexosaminidase
MNVKKVLLLIFCGFVGNLSASEESPLPVIFAVSGTELTPEEVAFFKEFHPIGTILSVWNLEFDEQRNVNKEKLKELCSHIHAYCPHILMDQEGGRVQRLKGPNCYNAPAPGSFSEGVTEENFEERCEALRQNVRRIDEDLLEVGIDVNCAPVCDLLFNDIPSFIGNRSFGTDPKMVYRFAVTWVEQANEDEIISTLKHCPGHGSTVADSHLGLPVVDKSLPELM